ncbi:MAG: prepilin peptidase [Acidimicrobiales bacterium]
MSLTLAAELVMAGGLVCLTLFDLDRRLLPKKVLYPSLAALGAVLLVTAGANDQWSRLGVAVACGAGCFAVFAAVHSRASTMLGLGDVRLAALLGVGLGWLGVGTVVLGFLAAISATVLTGGALVAARRANLRTRIPLGVFLAAGAEVALLVPGPALHL